MPIIAVPTTAGTAAEVTINYVITDVERKRKFVCVDPHDMPIIAVVDPEMMSSMPKGLTASTGMDALTHAIEGYTTKAAWEMTDMFHLKAIEIISKSLRGAVANTPEGREGMALGQYIAGMGFACLLYTSWRASNGCLRIRHCTTIRAGLPIHFLWRQAAASSARFW